MRSGVGTALGLIGIILSAGAIGFAFIVWNGQNTTNSALNSALDDLINQLNNMTDQYNNLIEEFNNLTKTLVVGEWDALNDNYDNAPHNLTNDWLFQFGSNNVSNTDYILVSNNDTRITLLKAGWYRIHLSVLLQNISPSLLYKISILKDGPTEFVLYRLVTGTTVVSDQHFDSSGFVYSNGTNYLEFNGYSNGDNDFEPYIDAAHDYNQLSIEYAAL